MMGPMGWIGWSAIGALLGVGIWLALTFNAFVRLGNRVREAWSGIDVQLKRRHDVIPNLVKVVGAYARHERETLEEITRLRGEASGAEALADRERSENRLGRSLDRLIALVERYPDLKADANFRQLQQDLVEVEEQLQYARRYYNGAVRDLNNRVEQFPANLVAPVFGVSSRRFFEIESPVERGAPRVVLEAGA